MSEYLQCEIKKCNRGLSLHIDFYVQTHKHTIKCARFMLSVFHIGLQPLLYRTHICMCTLLYHSYIAMTDTVCASMPKLQCVLLWERIPRADCVNPP